MSILIVLVAIALTATAVVLLFRDIDEDGDTEREARVYKSQATFYIFLIVFSLVGILLICGKKCEFFSIWTPLFIFISSTSLFILNTIAILFVRPL